MEVPKGPRGSFKAQPTKGCQRYMSKVLDSHHEFSRSILSPINFKSSNSRNSFTRKHTKSLNNPTVYQFYTLKTKQSTNFPYTNQIEVASDRTCQPWIAEVQSMQWFFNTLISTCFDSSKTPRQIRIQSLMVTTCYNSLISHFLWLWRISMYFSSRP